MQPRNVTGTTTSEKIRPICLGLTTVPITSPKYPATRAARSTVAISIGQLATETETGSAETRSTIGSTAAAAMIDWRLLQTTFSRATMLTGSGAMTRSSISRVPPSSVARGRATAAMPWKKIATATSPGAMTVAKLTWVPPPGVMPAPIFGNT